jgi:hypothetical protein
MSELADLVGFLQGFLLFVRTLKKDRAALINGKKRPQLPGARPPFCCQKEPTLSFRRLHPHSAHAAHAAWHSRAALIIIGQLRNHCFRRQHQAGN